MITTNPDLRQPAALLYLSGLAPSGRKAQYMSLTKIVSQQFDGAFGLADFPWHELSPQQLLDLKQSLVRDYAPNTVQRVLSGIRGCLRISWMQGLMETREYELARQSIKGFVAMSIKTGRMLATWEIEALMQAASAGMHPLRNRAIIAVMFEGGLRTSEIIGLDLKHYNKRSLSVEKSKGLRSRLVPLDRACARLDEWIWDRGDRPGPLFPTACYKPVIGYHRLTPDGLKYICGVLRRRAGIEMWTPHDARRTYVSTLLATGSDLATAAALAGHSKAETTQTYDKRPYEARIAAVARLQLPI